jgi:UDPglucose 6-dehydrogenase
MRINAEQRRVFLKKVRSALWTLRGKKLAALGLAFKGDTDDVRESPAIEIIEALLAEGAKVRAYDPAAIGKTREISELNGLEYAADAYDAMTGADALLILTEWKEFASLDLNRVQKLLKYPIVIDGRNLYERNQMTDVGLIYYSIGRSVAAPKHLTAAAQEPETEVVLPIGGLELPSGARSAA